MHEASGCCSITGAMRSATTNTKSCSPRLPENHRTGHGSPKKDGINAVSIRADIRDLILGNFAQNQLTSGEDLSGSFDCRSGGDIKGDNGRGDDSRASKISVFRRF